MVNRINQFHFNQYKYSYNLLSSRISSCAQYICSSFSRSPPSLSFSSPLSHSLFPSFSSPSLFLFHYIVNFQAHPSQTLCFTGIYSIFLVLYHITFDDTMFICTASIVRISVIVIKIHVIVTSIIILIIVVIIIIIIIVIIIIIIIIVIKILVIAVLVTKSE